MDCSSELHTGLLASATTAKGGMESVSTQKKAALHTPLTCFLTPPTPTVTVPPDDRVARSLKSLASQQSLRRKKR
jgi:hypothetical protein